MQSLGLEIHDAGLIAVLDSSDGPEIVADSPGYALLDGESLRTGVQAARSARHKPRHVHSRFWQELETEPLGRPFPRMWSAADLAHAHLGEVWQAAGAAADRAWLAISGGYSKRQIEVVLGVARAAGIPIAGVTDAAVAAVSTLPLAGPVVHLDLHLHRLVATRLSIGDEIVREQVETNDAIGLASLHETWARQIADALVRTTRFDPFHAGSTEQQLYDSLPGWLAEARDAGRLAIRFTGRGSDPPTGLDLNDVIDAAEPAYAEIEELARRLSRPGEATTLALSRHLAELPGTAARMAAHGYRVEALPAAAAAIGALQAGLRLATPDGEIRLVTRLPSPTGSIGTSSGSPPSVATEPVSDGEPARPPTHLLRDGVAHPIVVRSVVADSGASYPTLAIEGDVVVLEPDGETLLNGEALTDRAPLAVGDRLRPSGAAHEMIAIRLAEEDEPA